MHCRTGTWLLLALLFSLRAAAMPGSWKLDGSGELLSRAEEEACTFRLTLPGAAQIYREPERKSFRPERSAFEAAQLETEIRLEAEKPVKALLFFKDKDGNWFQTVREFELVPGRWQTLSARLDRPGEEWRGVGHGALFDADAATNLFAAGVSLYSDRMQEATLTIRALRRTGRRHIPPLSVVDWQLADKGEKNRRIDSRFLLSREYFNPFDPDECCLTVFSAPCYAGEYKNRGAFIVIDKGMNVLPHVLPHKPFSMATANKVAASTRKDLGNPGGKGNQGGKGGKGKGKGKKDDKGKRGKKR